MVDKNELSALFQAYTLVNKEVSAAKDALEQKIVDRSNAVRQILSATGSKGPFAYNGDHVKIVVRGELCFFRGKSVNVIEVE